MDERIQVIIKFYKTYNWARKKYGLIHRVRFSIRSEYETIEVWELKGDRAGKCIVNVKQEEETECYKQALWELEYYIKNREEKEHAGNAAMAV